MLGGYLVLVDSQRYAAQAESKQEAEQRAREALGPLGKLVDASRKLTEDEVTVLQLRMGEVRLYPAEHG
jgi:hypothetical protein